MGFYLYLSKYLHHQTRALDPWRRSKGMESQVEDIHNGQSGCSRITSYNRQSVTPSDKLSVHRVGSQSRISDQDLLHSKSEKEVTVSSKPESHQSKDSAQESQENLTCGIYHKEKQLQNQINQFEPHSYKGTTVAKTWSQSLRQTMAFTKRQDRSPLEGHSTVFALLNTRSEGALVAVISR